MLVFRGIVFLTIVLFFIAGVMPSMGVNIVKRNVTHEYETTFTTLDSWGYIQDLIDNASDGDTISIPSGIYFENIIINKSISLVGEDKDTTIIDGNYSGTVVSIVSDWVNISGFTIQKSGDSWDHNDAGINIYSNHITIIGNIISYNNRNGIYLCGSSNIIKGNNINSNNGCGIVLTGVQWVQSDNNIIKGNNIISNKEDGIHLYGSSNIITGNNISDNEFGIYLEYSSSNNIIYHNNFINNTKNALDEYDNTWDDGKKGNYWSDYEEKYPDAHKLKWRGIWDTPYEIEGGDNKDRYPLIKQWSKSKSKTISRNAASYSYYLLSFLEQFPILQKIIQRLGLQ